MFKENITFAMLTAGAVATVASPAAAGIARDGVQLQSCARSLPLLIALRVLCNAA